MKITSEEMLGSYQLLQVDGLIPSFYSHVLIGGKRFDPVQTHNLDNYVVIESSAPHAGMDLQFVSDAVMKDG